MPDPAAASSLGFKPSVGLGCCLVLSGFSLLQCFSDQRCESGSARREVVAVARATGGVCKGSLCPVRIPGLDLEAFPGLLQPQQCFLITLGMQELEERDRRFRNKSRPWGTRRMQLIGCFNADRGFKASLSFSSRKLSSSTQARRRASCPWPCRKDLWNCKKVSVPRFERTLQWFRAHDCTECFAEP